MKHQISGDAGRGTADERWGCAGNRNVTNKPIKQVLFKQTPTKNHQHRPSESKLRTEAPNEIKQ